jgi:hypothetical protein
MDDRRSGSERDTERTGTESSGERAANDGVAIE